MPIALGTVFSFQHTIYSPDPTNYKNEFHEKIYRLEQVFFGFFDTLLLRFIPA